MRVLIARAELAAKDAELAKLRDQLETEAAKAFEEGQEDSRTAHEAEVYAAEMKLAQQEAELAELRAKLEPLACGHLNVDLELKPEHVGKAIYLGGADITQSPLFYCRRCREREELIETIRKEFDLCGEELEKLEQAVKGASR